MTWTAPADAGQGTSYEVVVLPTMTVHRTDKTELQISGLEPEAEYSFEIRTVLAGAKSDPAKAGPVTITAAKPSWAWLWSCVAVVAVVLVFGVVALLTDWPANTRHGLVFACGVLGFGLLLLTVTGGSYGFWRAVIGADGRV